MRLRIEPTTIDLSIDLGPDRRDEDVVITDGPPADATQLVRIQALGRGILLRTPTFSSGLADLTVMFVDESQRLFVGAKQTSFVVDLARGQADHIVEHFLFWGFNRSARPGWILETGELECLFRALDGQVVARVPVDPPWDYTEEEGGLLFESMVNGVTFLPFPDAK